MAFCDDRKQIRFEAPDSRSHYEGRDTIEISHNQKRGMRRRRRESESMQNQRECWAGRGDKRQLMHNVCRSSLWVTILYCVYVFVCVCVCVPPRALPPSCLSPIFHSLGFRVAGGRASPAAITENPSLSVCLFVCLSICLSVCLPVCVYVCVQPPSPPPCACMCAYMRV